MRGFKYFWFGIVETYRRLGSYTLACLGWWLGLLTVVLAPSMTVTLFRVCDPRANLDFGQLTIREALAATLRGWLKAWSIALLIVPLGLALSFNLLAYDGGNGVFAQFGPLWLFMLVIVIVWGMVSFSIAGTTEQSGLAATRTALLLVARRPFGAIVLFLLLYAVFALSRIVIFPALFIFPAIAAATVNRLTLDGLGLDVFDPYRPTPERLAEGPKKRKSYLHGPRR